MTSAADASPVPVPLAVAEACPPGVALSVRCEGFPGPIGLRALGPADLPAVMTLEVQSYSHPWSLGNFSDSLRSGYWMQGLWLDADPGPGGVAEPPELAGYWVAMAGVEEVHLLNLTVAPRHQGRGLGRLLMAQIRDRALAAGLSTLWLEVRQGNHRARALYAALGLVEVGVRRGYYPAAVRREDAVVMRWALADAAPARALTTPDPAAADPAPAGEAS